MSALAALLAKDAREQQLVRDVFDELFQESLDEPAVDEEQPPPAHPAPKRRRDEDAAAQASAPVEQTDHRRPRGRQSAACWPSVTPSRGPCRYLRCPRDPTSPSGSRWLRRASSLGRRRCPSHRRYPHLRT